MLGCHSFCQTAKKSKTKKDGLEMMKKRKTKRQKAARKSCQTQRHWCLDLIGDTRSRWQQIGTDQGLSSDTQIASFLINQ